MQPLLLFTRQLAALGLLLTTASVAHAQTLTIAGTGGSDNTHDVTAFVDKVEIVRVSDGVVMSAALSNASFETSNPLDHGNYGYNPTGASWTFANTTGIQTNGSAFSAPTNPDGTQGAFIQNYAGQPGSSAISQQLTLAAGTYKVRFLAAQRTCCNTPYDQGLVIMVSGLQIGSTTPVTSYASYLSGAFTVNSNNTVTVNGTTAINPTLFGYTGGDQTYTVPAGITQLQVVATGASGGLLYDTSNSNYSSGARVQATVTVTPGEVLTVRVGGQGTTDNGNGSTVFAGGFNGGGAGTDDGVGDGGGGGGGATDLRRTSASRTGDYLSSRNALLVAGGGGGSTYSPGIGGNGGTPAGGNGGVYGGGGSPGQGATQAGPGAGTNGAASGNNSQGGNAGDGPSYNFGGGGGGGYYGGSGGSANYYSDYVGGGGGSSWVMPTGSSNISYSVVSASNGSLTITPISATPLPVQLVAFTVEAVTSAAHLRWNTASEQNNNFFDVEVSTNGRSFTRLGTVAGHGTTSLPQAYTFIDENLARYAASLLYYRLRQVDRSSTDTYSPVRTIAVNTSGLVLYPNPAGHTTTFSGAASGAQVRVYDALGNLVLSVQANTVGIAELVLPATLPQGLYLVRSGAAPALRLQVEQRN